MLVVLKTILEIQELDMQMIRLMLLKKERQRELKKLAKIYQDLKNQASIKEAQILELKKDIKLMELEVQEIKEKIEKLESQQNSIKKVDEFNALTHEISALEKQKHSKELQLSDMMDRLATEDEILKGLKDSLELTTSSSKALEDEIYDSIRKINEEGRQIFAQREKMAEDADPEVLGIYDRLLKNKKSRVIVPIENRSCSGCHITLTAQDENLVRKGERLLFCEHCSRIHYWPESVGVEEETEKTGRRRRRTTRAAS